MRERENVVKETHKPITITIIIMCWISLLFSWVLHASFCVCLFCCVVYIHFIIFHAFISYLLNARSHFDCAVCFSRMLFTFRSLAHFLTVFFFGRLKKHLATSKWSTTAEITECQDTSTQRVESKMRSKKKLRKKLNSKVQKWI